MISFNDYLTSNVAAYDVAIKATKYVVAEKVKAGQMVYVGDDGRVRGAVRCTLRVDTTRFDKEFNRVKHTTERFKWMCWSASGWRWCFRPFVRFHFWWTKPV